MPKHNDRGNENTDGDYTVLGMEDVGGGGGKESGVGEVGVVWKEAV